MEMYRITRRLLAQIEQQRTAPAPDASPQALWLLGRSALMLRAHSDDIDGHLQRLGGITLSGDRESYASAGAANAGSKKMMDDLYARLSFAHAACLMLETNARALNFSSTAALASRHRDELAAMLARIKEQTAQAA